MDTPTFERVLDKRIQERLASDRAYRNAANADEQAAREEEIEAEESTRLTNETGWQPGLSELLQF